MNSSASAMSTSVAGTATAFSTSDGGRGITSSGHVGTGAMAGHRNCTSVDGAPP